MLLLLLLLDPDELLLLDPEDTLDDPDLLLGFEKLRPLLEEDLLLLTLEDDELPEPDELLFLRDERTFVDRVEDPVFLFLAVTFLRDEETLGLDIFVFVLPLLSLLRVIFLSEPEFELLLLTVVVLLAVRLLSEEILA